MAYRPSVEQVQYQRVRVAAVLLEAERVLLVAHQFSGNPLAWLLPGGSLELGETVREATLREIHEETGLKAKVERLLFWREFFDWRYTLELTFLARPVGGELAPGYDPEFGDDDQVIKKVGWFPLNGLAELPVVPVVLKEWLPAAAHAGFRDPPRYLGLSESFAEALRGWEPGTPPDRVSRPKLNLP